MNKELYQLSAKITFEAAIDNAVLDVFKNYLFDKFKKETSLKESECFYYFTFIGEDYRNKIIHLVVTNKNNGYFIASVPKDKSIIFSAFKQLKKLNSHLILKTTTTGLDGDDFIMERISIKLEYLKK